MVSRSDQDRPIVIKKRLAFLVGLASLAVTLACLSINRLSPSQAALPTPEASQGLIAYIGNDGNIYTTDLDGKQSNAITTDANLHPDAGQEGRVYQYPAWAPDGQHLAFVGFRLSESGPEVNLFSALANGKKTVTAFTSQNFQPFYLSWSPDSQLISFLGNGARGTLDQYLVPGSGGESKLVSSGQPYYWDWSPDSSSLILHIGGSHSANPDAHLTFIGLDGSNSKQELDLKPGSFEAPDWSPDGGTVVVAAQNEAGKEELILAGQDGDVKQVLAPLNGPVAFAWSPKGVDLAYAVTELTGRSPEVHLFVMDSTHPDRQKQVIKGEMVAFFWSPDGQKIAYFMLGSEVPSAAAFQTVAQTQPKAVLVVWVYDRSSGSVKEVASFVPTLSFSQVLPFYSQYQRSATIWSPDSQSLVLAGIDTAGENAIYTVGADGNQFQKIADGDLAFWSWK